MPKPHEAIRLAACALAVAIAAGCAPRAAARVAVEQPGREVSGSISGTVYTAADGAFRVSVPPVFVGRHGGGGEAAPHDGLRLEDGRAELEGARVDFVLFGPSPAHAEEIYHVVLADPDPYRRYDDLARRTDAVITEYLGQYDAQHVGVATELVRRDVEVGERSAMYAAYRYEFVRGETATGDRLRSYVAFCVVAAEGHRLVTTVVERRPAPADAAGSGRWDGWRERSYRDGGCDEQWLASFELGPAAPATLALRTSTH